MIGKASNLLDEASEPRVTGLVGLLASSPLMFVAVFHLLAIRCQADGEALGQ